MCRFWAALAGIVVLYAAGVPGAQSTRQVWVRVTEKNGAAIKAIAADQFTVIENGVSFPAIKAEPMEWTTRLTILVDNGLKSSGYLLNLRNGIRGLFSELAGAVETSLLTLAPQPRWIVRATTNASQLDKGIGRIAPDGGTGKFFDGLLEAVDRAVKDKASFFPVVVVVASTLGTVNPPSDPQYARLQKELSDRAVTVHFVLLELPTQTPTEVAGFFQSRIGHQVTAMTGGRYENIFTATRLETLLPEIGAQIAKSAAKQGYQYRLTYEPRSSQKPDTIGIDVKVAGVTIEASVDGHLP